MALAHLLFVAKMAQSDYIGEECYLRPKVAGCRLHEKDRTALVININQAKQHSVRGISNG
jgi:hypothetical protein